LGQVDGGGHLAQDVDGAVERLHGLFVNQLFLCHQPGYSPPGSPPAKPVLTIG
jgi:hypothetical protein